MVQRSVSWQRLELLHRSLPRQYCDFEMLYLTLRREWVNPRLLRSLGSVFFLSISAAGSGHRDLSGRATGPAEAPVP
jgi:hypothetical protein